MNYFKPRILQFIEKIKKLPNLATKNNSIVLHHYAPVGYNSSQIFEATWEKYMGNFKEQTDISEQQDDLTLFEMNISKTYEYDYDNIFSILESKQQFGSPTFETLGSLLCSECSKIEAIRSKKNIGYYANSETNALGYRSIDNEDVANLEGVILSKIPIKTRDIDFILSSPGGYIEASLQLTQMIRQRFDRLAFLLPGSTYSAAVAMTFSGDEIIMQSNAHLAPINPRINGFDTYIGKKIYRTVKVLSICCPWALKHLPDAKITEQNVTMKVMESLENLVLNTAIGRLSSHLFKINQLSFFARIKTKIKIKRIVNFFIDYGRHHTHIMPFFIKELLYIGLPVQQADMELDKHLRKLRNLCEEITTTQWLNNNEVFYVRKIYFTSNHWYILKHHPSLKEM